MDEPATAQRVATAGVEPGTTTGVAAVDVALQRLQALVEAPLEEHVAIVDDVHRQLHEALAELDDEQ